MAKSKKPLLCIRCGATMESVVLPRYDRYPKSLGHIAFEDVPADQCPRCGELYFSAAVAKTMERIIQQAPEPPKRVVEEVPVYPLTDLVTAS